MSEEALAEGGAGMAPGTSGAIRVGVSSCLMGREVRFDGGHKRSRFVTDELAPFVDFVLICPEVEAGLPIPRPALRLVRGASGEVRMRETKSGLDHTEVMTDFVRRRVESLKNQDLTGYVFKKDSPSCGAMRVKIYTDEGMPQRDGVGFFARELMQAFPDLPIEEEGRLNDPALRENFIERLFAYQRLRVHFADAWTSGDMVAFHTAQKLQLMAHSPEAYRELGRLVADHRDLDRDAFQADYVGQFMAALKNLATPGRHANVMQHAMGYLKNHLDGPSKAELVEVIEDHRMGLIPLSVPITLIRHHVRVHEIEYLSNQIYLDPHPKELMLRNHV